MIRTVNRFHANLKFGFLILLMLLVVACNRDTDDILDNDYLVNYEASSVYPLAVIKSALSIRMLEYPELDDIVEHVKYSVQIYKINYKTHFGDSVVTASGLVCLPMADEQFPVISFQNGTNTDHNNAPSTNPTNPNYMMLEFMASNGYIVLITDYIGFGASSDLLHPYYHRTSSNNAVIDLIHAFGEMSQRNDIMAAGNDSVYLMGYSQGGWATLSAFDEIQQDGSLSFEVAAVSCGAGAYDLMTMSTYVLGVETFPGPIYLPYFIYSQQLAGSITDPLTKFFKEPYAGRIPGLFNGLYDNDEINSQLTNTISELVTADMLDNFETGPEYAELRALLNENSVSAWNTETKVNLYHGTEDIHVPPQQTSALYDDFISSGADPGQVSYIEFEGLTHVTGLLPWGIATINWFNALENK